jgi:hypothetical protein
VVAVFRREDAVNAERDAGMAHVSGIYHVGGRVLPSLRDSSVLSRLSRALTLRLCSGQALAGPVSLLVAFPALACRARLCRPLRLRSGRALRGSRPHVPPPKPRGRAAPGEL